MNRLWKAGLSAFFIAVVASVLSWFSAVQHEVKATRVAVIQENATITALRSELRAVADVIPVSKSRHGTWAVTAPGPTRLYIGPALSYYAPRGLPMGTLVLARWTLSGWDYVFVPSINKSGYVPNTDLLVIGKDN